MNSISIHEEDCHQYGGLLVVVLQVLGRNPLLSYPSLGWPRQGVVGRQDGVLCDGIICVIYSDP